MNNSSLKTKKKKGKNAKNWSSVDIYIYIVSEEY